MDLFEIAAIAARSPEFRRVHWTGRHSQLVTMTLQPGEEIGLETHDDIDQILVFLGGSGRAEVAGESTAVAAGQLLVVPAGTRHNVVAGGDGPLVLWTVYAPPEHPAGTVHPTKADADAAEHDH